MNRRTLLAAGLAAPLVARAQAPWPSAGPVRLIVPFAPGGTTDIIARLLAEQVSQRIGQTMVVENRGGAGATVGSTMVARAAPDGYTLLVATISGLAVAPALYRGRIAYDAERDFAQIAIILGTPYLLLVNPRTPYQTFSDFLAAARQPRGIDFATSGVGSLPHLLALRLATEARVNLTHVPYRGGAQAATDAIAGVVPSVIDSLTAASANIRAGALRALAVSSPQRVPAFPDIPTFAELGHPSLIADGWAGIAAPARTPRPIQERLAAAFREAMAVPAVARKYEETATLQGTRFLDEAQSFVRDEIAAWGPVVVASGATPD